ncbi:CPBP family glutamic-type intramembrane protease [Nodosilinea sp. P-1105]|uniref:CPBP family glutamic-type intramembrane protease n=1 Tax=Nodosilinea sp. P-1105 TaxID=2546229 RepID=UPI00146B5D8F|nr:CPBP family intramembrane metalloprotease [Nodosilinea sp. P-1105]
MDNLRLRAYITFRLVKHRLVKAVITWPTWPDWWLAAQLTVVFAVIIIPLGLATQLLTPTLADVSGAGYLTLAARLLVIPAIAEEVFWRVLLLPHRTEIVDTRKRWAVGLPMLGLFVLMHPLNAMTFYPIAFTTFTHPMFLLAAGLLGLFCTITYWRSGSGWIPVAMHWLVVTVWLMFLGGYGRLLA